MKKLKTCVWNLFLDFESAINCIAYGFLDFRLIFWQKIEIVNKIIKYCAVAHAPCELTPTFQTPAEHSSEA